jgi:hypothetical protein
MPAGAALRTKRRASPEILAEREVLQSLFRPGRVAVRAEQRLQDFQSFTRENA